MKTLTLALTILLSVLNAFSQTSYTAKSTESSVVIEGTSTLHDWEMVGSDFSSSYTAFYENNTLVKIESIVFEIPAKSLKSKEGKVMDNKAYESLKADAYPKIKFTGQKVINFETKGTIFNGIVEGTLYLAGVTKTIRVAFMGNELSDYTIITGSKTIDMTDFNMEPPTAAMGTIKSGSDITLRFKLKFKK